jgi:hypothetical protein
MRSWTGGVAATLALIAALATGRDVAAQLQVDVNRPRTIYDCDTPLGERWYGSTDRCLSELCEGQNVTNAQIVDASGRLRRNPCYGRDPFELSR